RTLGTQPVLMVRGSEGGVSVFLNRCAHRGTMVCPASHGNARTFACPYHGWTYGLGGELLGVPYPGGYASFDKSAHGLPRVPRLSSYRGFVFASLCPRGPSLDEHLGAATRLIDRSCDLSPEGEIELSAGWGGGGPASHRRGSGPCPHLSQPLPGRDERGHRAARERRGVRALAHADFSQGRAPVQLAAAPDERGGDGAGVVSHARRPHRG